MELDLLIGLGLLMKEVETAGTAEGAGQEILPAGCLMEREAKVDPEADPRAPDRWNTVP